MYDTRSIELNRTISFLDISSTVVVFLFSFIARGYFLPTENVDIYSHLFLIPLLLALLLFFLSYFGAYEHPRGSTIAAYIWAIFRGLSLTIGVLLTLLFFLNIQYVSRGVIIVFAFGEFGVLVLIRLVMKGYMQKSISSGNSSLRVLIIGTGERAKEIARKLKMQAEWGVKIIGHLDPDPERVGTEADGVPIIGTVDKVSECLKNNVVDEVIIAIPRSLLEDANPIVHACEEEGIKLRFMADLFDVHAARITLARVGNIPLLTMEPVAHDDGQLFIKRIFDLVITIAVLPVVLPVMAIAAVLIKLDSPGPVIFVQQRVGLRKHLFPMFKFRSMYADAEERLAELEHLNEAEGPAFKISNDPRVTRIGHLLRKTSIDELPQLFNVLRGEMSLVGPRPMSIRDVDLFDQGIQRKRFSVKPGLTCIWQISGRSDLPFSKWLELDLEYIERWSLWLDVEILCKTIPAVLKTKGAW